MYLCKNIVQYYHYYNNFNMASYKSSQKYKKLVKLEQKQVKVAINQYLLRLFGQMQDKTLQIAYVLLI